MLYHAIFFIIALCSSLTPLASTAGTLTVGQNAQFPSIRLACSAALPGDTILIVDEILQDASTVSDLRGREDAWITITGNGPSRTQISGGRGLQFSKPAYVRIENLRMDGQTGNAINIDDGGTLTEPAHHVAVHNVHFTGMASSGNIDYLKLSGLDSFAVTSVRMENGAAGGSGIDMVGCHHGEISGSWFGSMGSNAIQAKGGTRFITITRNTFVEAGQRAINLGGSTGLAFFRPQNAPHEAADLLVSSNVFIGGATPFAYVGCERVHCVNNTIIRPSRWIFRVLQETVDPQRFVACGNNVFRNNCVVFDAQVTTHVNVGANTAPETFTLEHNLWFNLSDASRSAPTLPVAESNAIHGVDPLLQTSATALVGIDPTSPCIGAGLTDSTVQVDFFGNRFANPPSIGAVEGALTSSLRSDEGRDVVAFSSGTSVIGLDGKVWKIGSAPDGVYALASDSNNKMIVVILQAGSIRGILDGHKSYLEGATGTKSCR